MFSKHRKNTNKITEHVMGGRRMTKKELSQLYYLDKEIDQLTYRIQNLRTQVENCTQHITDMPKGGQRVDLKDELIDLTKLLECKKVQRVIEQSRLEKYINNIKDCQMRLIIGFRYIDGLAWQQVAYKIGEYDEQYPRRKHNKFISR